MALLRSERFSALLLVAAALLGLVLANSPAAGAAHAVEGLQLGPLTLGHWVKDGLLAVFFFLAAVELRHELKHGELDSPAKALVPTVAAVGGVIVPALAFLLLAGPDLARGWPIPTATDIAFALGVLALLGRNLPPRVRALLLALAVIDDLIAILIIAAFFTGDLQPVPLLLAVPVVLAFGWLSHRSRAWAVPLLVVLGIVAWALVLLSGIHPTIAGVALGLVMADESAARARHALEPWSNLLVLPLFALTAALVALPSVGLAELSPAFWAVVIALPLGKLVGITGGALIVRRRADLPLGDILVVAGLGGIGFTVSLLMNELAFGAEPELADQVTLAVLLASAIAVVVGGTITALRSRVSPRS